MSTIKKFIYFFSITFIFMFIGVINVKAIDLNISGGNTRGSIISVNIKDAAGNALIYDYNSISCNNSACTSAAFFGNDGREIASNDVTFEFKINTSDNKNLNFKIVPTDGGTGTLIEKNYEINVRTQAPVTTQTPTTAPPTTTQAKSTNANLASLHVTDSDGNEVELSPSFSSNTYEYSATVDATIRTINVDATMEDSHANLVISNNATEELVAGENNKITITVTAEDGTSKKAYVINIRREALTVDATLKSLSIKECNDFKFEEDKFSYNVKIANSVKKLTLDYETSSSDAMVSVSGNEDLKNGSKVKILVTAQDGTKRQYVLNIVKESNTTKKANNVIAEKNPLIIMALSIVAFGLIGGIVYVIKK